RPAGGRRLPPAGPRPARPRGARGRCRRPGAGAVLPPDRLRLSLLAVRSDHHDHVAAILLRLRLDEAEFLDIACQPLEQLVAELGPRLLSAPEHDRHLDLVPLPKEPLDVAPLGALGARVKTPPNLD